MKVSTYSLSGIQLDWAVSKATGILDDESLNSEPVVEHENLYLRSEGFYEDMLLNPSISWDQGGALIAYHEITLVHTDNAEPWYASCIPKHCKTDGYPSFADPDLYLERLHKATNYYSSVYTTPITSNTYGTTPLEAAMRCLVESLLGPSVDIPEEILCPT